MNEQRLSAGLVVLTLSSGLFATETVLVEPQSSNSILV